MTFVKRGQTINGRKVQLFSVILNKQKKEEKFDRVLASVHPEIVAFGSGQGRSEFETAGVARLRRKNMNGCVIIANSRERQPGPKDAISGWTLAIKTKYYSS